MASESSGTDFGTRVFNFCTNIINIIFVCTLEDQTITVILKKFTFIYISLKFSNSLQLCEVHFLILWTILVFQVMKVFGFVSYFTVYKIMKSQLNEFLIVLDIQFSEVGTFFIKCALFRCSYFFKVSFFQTFDRFSYFWTSHIYKFAYFSVVKSFFNSNAWYTENPETFWEILKNFRRLYFGLFLQSL